MDIYSGSGIVKAWPHRTPACETWFQVSLACMMICLKINVEIAGKPWLDNMFDSALHGNASQYPSHAETQ
jgi:hypothetical protein